MLALLTLCNTLDSDLIRVSGAGSNLKVGAHVRCFAPEIFFVVSLYIFGCTSTISRFGECVRDGQYSLVSLLFDVLLLTVLDAKPFVKVREVTCPLYHMESTPLLRVSLRNCACNFMVIITTVCC